MKKPSVLRLPAGTRPEPAGDGSSLAVHDARKSFSRVEALAGVDFALGAGEWVGLIGPNGAGKTTLMRALVGLIELDAGEVLIGGQRMTRRRAPGLRGMIGLVPQEIALYPALSARENLTLFGRLHGVERSQLDQRIAWALEWTALAERSDEPVGGLSLGMQRRLNIACGVLHRPRIVLLDEPTVGIDPHGRQRVWSMLAALQRDGAALLQSSHQLDEIQNACDRMLILDRGRLIARGTLDELAAETALGDRRVRILLDRPPTAPHGLVFPPDAELELEGREIEGILHDVTRDLPRLLDTLERSGLTVESLEVSAPRLEDVFIQLTGGSLRE